MNIYYYANQVYQFSYVKSIYERLGGVFLVPKFRKVLRFKRRMRNSTAFPEIKTFLNTPPVMSRDPDKIPGPNSTIIAHMVTRFASTDGPCTTIFIGHGTGDRKYGGNLDNLRAFDYHFISGPKHLEKLRDSQVSIPGERLIKIGNPRFDAYVNGEIDREACMDALGIVDRDRKNILYAPTWQKGKGTLHQLVYRFCRELTGEFNLIVRPHHFVSKSIPKIKAWAALNGIRHVYFSNSNNLLHHDTMSDFIVSDLLISDTSSIQYEYLITGKPMIVAELEPVDLHAMPAEMDVRSITPIYDGSPGANILNMIVDSLTSSRAEEYRQMLNDCFFFNDGSSTNRAVKFITDLQRA
ncbi:CDP-glycerol glycerophosphotransferase family protein [Candidatus Neomarinimicrobiota bacterium]